MRRIATILTSIFVLWSSFIYAVDNEEIPKHYQLQGAFEGQNIENLEEAEARFLKGQDNTPAAIQREDLPGIRSWGTQDYINVSPKDRKKGLLNMGSSMDRPFKSGHPQTTITPGTEAHSEMRTEPIKNWGKDQYLQITPADKHEALKNLQKAPVVTAGTETNVEARTKNIADYSQGELLDISPDSRHDAISNSTRSFRVGRTGDITIDLTADYWYSESTWNLYDSTAGAYYYTTNQTFSSAYENQVVTLSLDEGSYSVDVWDSYGDGGVSGTVTDANAIVLVTITSSYGSFGQFGFSVDPPTFDVTISLDADYWYSESSWNVYDSSTGAYYYSTNQTFSSAYENQTVTLALEAGIYSVDVWDSYGDGGVSGTVSDADGNTLATITSSYGSFGQFGFGIGLYDITASLDADYWYSESSWNLYDSTAGAYYYSSNQTFSSAYENQTTLFSLAEGAYSIDVWDSYGDGGVSGTVSDADGNTLVTITSSYGSFGQFGFNVVAPVAVTSDLFFSEYIEGSSNNKAIEVYNPTDDTLSLDNYLIYTNYNGNPWSGTYTFPAGASLLPGEVFVAAHSSASDDVLQAADSAYAYGDGAYITSFNGDDVRALVKLHGGDSTIIDYIGLYDLVDPGAGWDVAGVSDATKDHTIIRKSSVTMGNTDWTASAGTDSSDSEWMVYDQNYFANIGGHPEDPCWDNVINLSVSSVSWGSEISYMLTNADGDTLVYSAVGSMANNQTDSYDLCLEDGVYSFWGLDDYGDGWNGGSFTVTTDDGSVIASGAVESSDGADTWVEFPFAINLPVFSSSGDVDFAGNVIGTSDTKSLTVTNAGYGDSAIMVIDAVSSDNAAFAVSGTVPATLAAGESADFSVTYTAGAEGDEEGEITISHDGDTSSVSAYGFGVDAVFFEDFDPWTGSGTELPMDGWTILDNNGDADSIPQIYKTWYHDDYGIDYSGNMVAYIGFSNSYDADEALISPMIHLPSPSKVTFWMYDYGTSLDVGYTTASTVDSSEELTHIASREVNGQYVSAAEVILPDVDSLRISFSFSGTSYTYMNFDEVTVIVLPNTFASGTVTDLETGAGIDSVEVDLNGNIVYTDTSGAYALYGFTPGTFDLGFSKEGYNDESFWVEVAEGDTIEQDMAMDPESLIDYYTGFETGDDQGSSVIDSGSTAFVVVDSFYAIHMHEDDDTLYYTDSTWIFPYDSSKMVVYPDSGAGYEHNVFTSWQAGETVDVSDYHSTGSYLYLSFNTMYDTEDGFDLFLAGVIGDDSLFYWNEYGELSGSTAGYWNGITLNMTWIADHGLQTATPFIAFMSDDGWAEGWGGAFDNVRLEGNPFYLAPPENLMAESYGSSIPISWDAPAAAGQASHVVYRADLRNINSIPWPTYVDENGNTVENRRGKRAFEQSVVEFNYTGSSRELASYNIFKREWPFGEFELLDNTDANSYTDDDVEDGDYFNYRVTAVYEEGESYSSDVARSYVGTPEVQVFDPDDATEDFEGTEFLADWEAFYSTDAAEWVVGDSAAADSAFGIGASMPAPDHTNFAYISDGRAGDADFASYLISPFLDFSDFQTGVVNMAGYAQVFSNFYDNNTCKFLARVDLGDWETIINFGYDHNSGWGDYSGPMSHVVGGQDKVQLAIYYTHVGGLNSGYGNGIAIDDLALSVISGPSNLEAAATTEDVTLVWDAPSEIGRPNEYPNLVSQAEKDMALALNGNYDSRPPNPSFSRVQGDSIGNPFVIDSVPYFDDAEFHQIFWDSASTVGFTDDYDEACPYTGSVSPDVVYELTLEHDAVKLYVDICESYYDSKVYMYANGDVTDLVACNDDYCTASHGQAWTSYFEVADVSAGTYHIVIDGYGGDAGTYILNVGVQYNYPGLTYNVYKNGSMVEDELDTTTWVDESPSLLENDYHVNGTVYRSFNMGNATADTLITTEASNVVSAAMVNQPPGDFILLSPSDGDTIDIREDDLGSNQIFAWSASVDPNGTQVEYEVCVTVTNPFDQFCEDNGTSTAQLVPLADIAGYIDSLHQAVGTDVVFTFGWTVYATDGMDETEAGNGPRTVTFDAGWVLGVDDELGIPDVFALHQNYPNPFNPVTTIRFDVPQESHVQMDIYNILGQRVRTLINGTMQPGYHAIRWNGTNDTGKPLASGMYIYRIHSSEFTSVKKLVLMK